MCVGTWVGKSRDVTEKLSYFNLFFDHFNLILNLRVKKCIHRILLPSQTYRTIPVVMGMVFAFG